MNTNALIYDSIDESKRVFHNYHQLPEDDNEIHLRTFKSNSDVVEHSGGSLYDDEGLIKHKKQ